ncbi:GH3 auxin-responsive promoter family protein [Oxynema aestuarii]|uniref:GH3 auxin-responsive promoter family protein n=1 Tax=Oxynema aestuarii AP17 TaxID=2064643 RepID=A0A6H1U3F4_9CYAN|nr:GH3 auxin-responsive promoter family protein [Oxynema aestuarii]QIZ73185.1 GH3 auxin-responsive promoter family protein [Oxynema aestuarii AP17]
MKNWQFIRDACDPFWVDFSNATDRAIAVQRSRLHDLLTRNQTTEIGRRYGFGTIADDRDYRDRVPIHTYEDLAEAIARMAAGETGVLCADEAIAVEVTGGSTSGSKLIPYTRGSLAAFQRALFPWLANLLAHRPGIACGPTYWAISPIARPQSPTVGPVTLPTGNDALYFGDRLAPHIVQLLAVPPQIAAIAAIDRWRYLTALYLLASPQLALISVWSPTFLLELLAEIEGNGDRLVRDLARGTTVPGLPPLPPNPERAHLVSRSLASGAIDTRQLWPQLDTISCWTDASAAAFVRSLQGAFPHVWIQGKGLLATEAAVTIPIAGCPSPVLAVESGFYEFIGEDGRSRLVHEVESGGVYRVVVTTDGGLYRYDLGDRVRVTGWYGQTPQLEFIGRAGLVSDLCGEKLTEAFVWAQLQPLHPGGFAMLTPCLRDRPHYILFLDEAAGDRAADLARDLDRALQTNPQYRYARQLGQLAPPVARCVSRPMEKYIEYALERGQRLGDIKPPVLRPETDWGDRL